MGNTTYIQVIFPLALPKLYTYAIPDTIGQVAIGCRVEAALKNKLYAGIVYQYAAIDDNLPKPRYINSVLDDHPIINEDQLHLWTWMAQYYCCSLGEVMDAGIPAGLKLSSTTTISLAHDADEWSHLQSMMTDDEYLIVEALSFQEDLTIEQIRDIVNKKSIYPLLKSLLEKNILQVKENLVEKYKAKYVKVVRLHPDLLTEDQQIIALDKIQKSQHQTQVLLAIIELSKNAEWIPVHAIKEYYTDVSHTIVQALTKKGMVEVEQKKISRADHQAPKHTDDLLPLTKEQVTVIDALHHAFDLKLPALIHGVTGSGKTRIYMEVIKEMLAQGRQVLYLLPEIALTTQIVDRLTAIFGQDILLYHSKLSDNERVDVWNEVLKGRKLVLTARSGVFLPFTNLGLIIVDEEHDQSYKQADPNPRYNGRDVAVYLAHQLKCAIILGSATPSVESYYNARQGRYHLITLDKRYGDVLMPKIEIVDLGYERKTGRYKPVISVPLQKNIRATLDDKHQVILFQNRRGYVPTLQCKHCGWTAMCVNCDVNLTFHRFINELSCHYCSHHQKPPMVCPQCGHHNISEVGSGTEKVEAIIEQYFPEYATARLDLDTARTKSSLEKIIGGFAEGKQDILVGTQMVSKGFDFEKVHLVGVIDADASLRIPDFRANERTFQLITQVAGRAGRRNVQGKVVIQTYSAQHPVIREIISGSYADFFHREIGERKLFHFPPFVRLIHIELKHKEVQKVNEAALYLTHQLKEVLGKRVQGPLTPAISRVRNQYLRHVMIKLEKEHTFTVRTKKYLMALKETMAQDAAYKSVRININVDPY